MINSETNDKINIAFNNVMLKETLPHYRNLMAEFFNQMKLVLHKEKVDIDDDIMISLLKDDGLGLYMLFNKHIYSKNPEHLIETINDFNIAYIDFLIILKQTFTQKD